MKQLELYVLSAVSDFHKGYISTSLLDVLYMLVHLLLKSFSFPGRIGSELYQITMG